MTPRGLTTSAIPHRGETFDVEFDFIDHQLRIRSCSGASRSIHLKAQSVADFYLKAVSALQELGLDTRIQSRPNEVEPAVPFAEDVERAAYDPDAAHLFWRQLLQANRVIGQFDPGSLAKAVRFTSSGVQWTWPAPDSPAVPRQPTPVAHPVSATG